MHPPGRPCPGKSNVYNPLHRKTPGKGRRFSPFPCVIVRLECLFTRKSITYAQPKSLFIHNVHRIIHKFTGEKPRKIADFTRFIHIIHRLSTDFVHNSCVVNIAVDMQKPWMFDVYGCPENV